jgi:hypothetical protein
MPSVIHKSFANLPPHARILPPEDFGVVLRQPDLNLALHHEPISDEVCHALDFIAVHPLTMEKRARSRGEAIFSFTVDFSDITSKPIIYGAPMFANLETAVLVSKAFSQAKIYRRASHAMCIETLLKLRFNNDHPNTWPHFHPQSVLIEVLKGLGTLWWENSHIFARSNEDTIKMKDGVHPRQLEAGDTALLKGGHENGLVHAIPMLAEGSSYRAVLQTSFTRRDHLRIFEADMMRLDRA